MFLRVYQACARTSLTPASRANAVRGCHKSIMSLCVFIAHTIRIVWRSCQYTPLRRSSLCYRNDTGDGIASVKSLKPDFLSVFLLRSPSRADTTCLVSSDELPGAHPIRLHSLEQVAAGTDCHRRAIP